MAYALKYNAPQHHRSWGDFRGLLKTTWQANHSTNAR
jgi:hypothetical protein